MAKYKGKDLSLTIDGTEISLEGTTVLLDNEEADTDSPTFAELANGTPTQWFFTIEAYADYGANSVWSLLWDNSGATVAFVLRPNGTGTGKVEFTGNCTINAKPPVGGTANEAFTFEARLDVDGEPTKVTQV
jgi:hypothetical protein